VNSEESWTMWTVSRDMSCCVLGLIKISRHSEIQRVLPAQVSAIIGK